MSSDTIFNVVFLFVVLGLIAWGIQGAQARAAMFVAAGKKLGVVGLKHSAGSLQGTVRGLGLDVMFVSGSKTEQASTKVQVTFSPCALMLHLRKQTIAEERAVRAGDAVDLTIGDPEFDAAWIVEGAPAERVTRLLSDPVLRRSLLAFSELDSPSISIEDGKVHLHKDGQDIDGNTILTERIELALAVAEAVVDESETPLAGAEVDPAGSDYRSVRTVDTRPAGAAKIAELKRLRAARARKELRVVAIATMGMLTAFLGFVVAKSESIHRFAVVPVLLFQAFVTAGLAQTYRGHKKSAPDVPSDYPILTWIGGAWIVNVTLAVWAIVTR